MDGYDSPTRPQVSQSKPLSTHTVAISHMLGSSFKTPNSCLLRCSQTTADHTETYYVSRKHPCKLLYIFGIISCWILMQLQHCCQSRNRYLPYKYHNNEVSVSSASAMTKFSQSQPSLALPTLICCLWNRSALDIITDGMKAIHLDKHGCK